MNRASSPCRRGPSPGTASLAVPLDSDSRAPWVALVLHGADIDEKARACQVELVLGAAPSCASDAEKERMRRQIEHREGASGGPDRS